jgi:hypothetical protein
MEVMHAQKLCCNRLLDPYQMLEIGPREATTGRAATHRIELFLRESIYPSSQIYLATRGETHPLDGERRRQDTIKHIYSTFDRFEKIDRCTYSHQIAWFVGRQQFSREFRRILSLEFGFSDGQTA